MADANLKVVPGPRRLRILVADDERDAVAMLEIILRDEGHEVYSVFDGQDVLEAVSSFQPDVVLLDIGMPKLTGYDVARKLRERHGKTLRLIAVTGWKQGSDRVLAKIAGFNHHIGKPYEPRALIELLAKATQEDL
jgi:CheY-like chemotaxis protein